MSPLSRLLACVAFLLGATAAAADPVSDAADAVLAAVRSGGDLKTLAERDDADPWLVADELCARGEHDAAAAFAKAAPRKETERLPDYVAAQRAKPTDPQMRKALAAATAFLRKDPQQALAALETVQVADDVQSIEVLRVRGLALRTLDRLEEREEALRAAAQGAERLGWLERAGMAFHESARCAWMRCDHAKALESLESALRLQEQLTDRTGMAATLCSLGGVHADLGSYARALEYLERALKLEEGLHHPWGTARALTGLGFVHRRLGSLAKALEYEERALELATNRMDASVTLTGLGAIYADLGSYERALQFFERALVLQTDIGYWPGVSTILISIGRIHSDLGSHQKALEYSERALKIAEQSGDPQDMAIILHDTGVVHARLGSYAKALEYLERALKLEEATGAHAEFATSLGSAGGVHAALGHNAEAEARFRRALELTRELRHAEQAKWATSLGRLLAEKLGRPAEALPFLEEAIVLIEARREEARAFSDREKATFFDRLRAGGAFECMARAQLKLDRAGEALAYLERGRARGVLDLLERSRFDPLGEAERRAKEQHDDARVREIADVTEALENTEREVTRSTNIFESKRAAKSPSGEAVSAAERERTAALEAREAVLGKRARLVRDLLPVGAPATPAALQLGLGPKERMLFYAFDESGGLLFVVPPQGGEVKGYVLTWPDGEALSEKSLAEAVDAWLQGMRRPGGRGLAREAEAGRGGADRVSSRPSCPQRCGTRSRGWTAST